MSEMQTIYNPIPENLYENYMNNLVNRIFKILPLKEENSDTIEVYITNLLYELTGNKELITVLQNDSQYETILANLQILISDNENYRSIVLGTIPIVNQLKNKYCKRGEKNGD